MHLAPTPIFKGVMRSGSHRHRHVYVSRLFQWQIGRQFVCVITPPTVHQHHLVDSAYQYNSKTGVKRLIWRHFVLFCNLVGQGSLPQFAKITFWKHHIQITLRPLLRD